MGELPSELNDFILDREVDEKGLSEFLDPNHYYFTAGKPKQDVLQQLAEEQDIPNEAIWVIDDREEEVCKPARELGFIVFNSDVVRDDKDHELQKVKTLLNQILTKANDDIPITLDGFVPEMTQYFRESEERTEISESANSSSLEEEGNGPRLLFAIPPIKIEMAAEQERLLAQRGPEKDQESNGNIMPITASDLLSANNNSIKSLAPGYQTPQFRTITQQEGGFAEFFLNFKGNN